jgi:DNA-binding transcriptional MerR regulator
VTDDGDEREAWEEALDDATEPLYTVGVVAELMGVEPQVVRSYDRRGVVRPGRARSGHRRYSRDHIRRLARAMRLSEEGIPPRGITRILELEDALARHADEDALARHAHEDEVDQPGTGDLD